jgi:hypothetical protein
MKIKFTQRGFSLAEFTDRYGQKCSIQKSSLATEDAIWLGIANTGPHIKGPGGEMNEDICARMHLTVKQVKTLLPLLNKFVETGEL